MADAAYPEYIPTERYDLGETSAAVYNNQLRNELHALMRGFPLPIDGSNKFYNYTDNVITTVRSQNPDAIATYTFVGDRLSQIAIVFDAAELDCTMTVDYTWTHDKISRVDYTVT